jgi:quercetin dioxygenase-like cupin family protein
MKKKKNTLVDVITILVLAALTIPGTTMAQTSGTKRTNLLRNDLSVQGREVIQVRVDIEPGVVYPKHAHPGEEIVYVVDGILEYHVEGKPPVTLKAGEALFIPHGAAHSVKNVGSKTASEIATYIVEKGKLLISIVK